MIFLKSTFEEIFQDYQKILDPAQAWQNTQPDLGPNCLQKISANDTVFPVHVSVWLYITKYVYSCEGNTLQF